MNDYPDCDLCDEPVDKNSEHLTYNGTYLCERCLQQAVIDDERKAEQCTGCGDLWHTDFLKPTKAELAGWHRDGRPYYAPILADLLCPPCGKRDYGDEIREVNRQARQAELDHARDVIERSIRALNEAT
jgi:hypothetical protein